MKRLLRRAEQIHYPDWVKIPVSMQHQFFELAAKEAERTKLRLLEQKKRLEQLQASLQFQRVQESNEWRDWRIAYVDGSDSPVISERLGARFGTYAAGWNIYHGDELESEEYFSGKMIDFETGDAQVAKKTLDLLAACLERDVALRCLEEEKPDLLVLDGSFYGFGVRSRLIRNRRIDQEDFEYGSELVDHVVNSTSKLLGSGRAVGIVKRVTTAAIDGWIIKRDGDDRNIFHTNDRHILSQVMTTGQVFSYTRMFGEAYSFNILSRLASAYRRYVERLSVRNIDVILRNVRSEIEAAIRRNLGCPPDIVLATERMYLRSDYPAPPMCIEIKAGADASKILPYLFATHSSATGLPLPLDMIDQNVGLPRGFTREFVEEIEANLVRDPELDKLDIQNHFAHLNPQKEE
jgi:hypothetical protein